MVSTPMQVAGWILGMLAWGGTVGMLMSEKWRLSSIVGDMASAVDQQDRLEGLWATCNKLPSGETHCTLLPIEVSSLASVVVGCRALMILAILFGPISAVALLFAFKCTSHGPQDEQSRATLGKYGGAVYLLCGVCVTVGGCWYVADVYTTYPVPDAKGNPMRWTTGEGVQMTIASGILWLVASGLVMLGSRSPQNDIGYEKKRPLVREYI